MTRGSLLVAAAVVAAVALCGSFKPASAEVEVCGHDRCGCACGTAPPPRTTCTGASVPILGDAACYVAHVQVCRALAWRLTSRAVCLQSNVHARVQRRPCSNHHPNCVPTGLPCVLLGDAGLCQGE